ncbi:MAG: IS110 family transposase [Fibromonadaceae bacterium]|jgi:transposase|nr:IS110 family transposase [Fibromonadaceae bacterium]
MEEYFILTCRDFQTFFIHPQIILFDMAKIAKKAEKAKKIKTGKGLKLDVVNPNAAGIDVSSTEMQVCVPEDRDDDHNRCFGTFTCDLHQISAWLTACRIDTVAMESTGIYWIPLYMRLLADGFDVLLGNAKAIKNIAEKSTDEVDAEWIMLLHSYGLIKASFQPCNFARDIRNLTRHRDNLLRTASKEVLRMQKYMGLMNIKLPNVISDILGKSGQDIISAIIKGERDPKKLALLADPRCKATVKEIEKSLEANWDENLIFMLKQCWQLYHYTQAQMVEIEKQVETLIGKYKAGLPQEMPVPSECKRCNKSESPKNKISIDIEQYAHELWGVNLMKIPGIKKGSLFRLVGELGHDFVSKFDSYKNFCNWANLVPNNKISGGKLLSSKLPKRKNPVGQILRVAASSLQNEKSSLGIYFRKIQAKKGRGDAVVATANKIGRIIYTMVKNKTEYDASLGQEKQLEILKKKVKRAQKELDKLQKKASACEKEN